MQDTADRESIHVRQTERSQAEEGQVQGRVYYDNSPLSAPPQRSRSYFGQPIDSCSTKLATPQTVVSANSGRWGRLHSAEVLTTLNTRSDPPGLYLKLAPTDV